MPKRDPICKSVDRAVEIISSLLAREKQVNPFLRNIDPARFELCLKATYLNHYSVHLSKDALEVVSACIFHDLSKEASYIELVELFRVIFAKLALGNFMKLRRCLRRPFVVYAIACVSVFAVAIYLFVK